MKLLVTYMNGKTQLLHGITEISAVKDSKGQTESIVIDHYAGFTRLEPRRETQHCGIKSMELQF